MSTRRKMLNGRLTPVLWPRRPGSIFCAPNWNAANPDAALAPDGTSSTIARCQRPKRWSSSCAPTQSSSAKTVIHFQSQEPPPVPCARRIRYSHSGDVESRSPLALQLRQLLLIAIFFLGCGHPVFHVVSGNFRFGLTQCLRVRHLPLHAVEGRGLLAIAHCQAGV